MISLHFNVDFAIQKDLDRGLLYLQRTQQKIVNIAGGAQLDLAMQFAERVRATLPKIVIQFRILEDTGIVMKLTPEQWYTRYIAPRRLWWKANNIIPVVDNETSGSDAIIKEYVARELAIAKMLHADGLNGSFCRFATGNIGDGTNGTTNQYPLLKPLLDGLNEGDWISPNEYSNRPGKSSAGHLERWKRIRAIASKPLNYNIGEAGILDNYQSRNGYRNFMSDQAMAAQLLSEEMWYEGGTVHRSVFLVGGDETYASCRVGEGALAFWEEYYAKFQSPLPPPIIPPPIIPPVVIPPPVTPAPDMYADLKAIQFGIKANITAINESIVKLTSVRDSLQSASNSIEKVIAK